MSRLRGWMFIFIVWGMVGCRNSHPHREPLGESFPSVKGQSLDEKPVQIPEDFAGAPVLLFIGYEQNSQFDIDRWLIALSMRPLDVKMVEVPTIPGLIPGLFSGAIDSGMRKGIPSESWGGVVTIYDDGDILARFTGDENRWPSRVVLLDKNGKVIFFHDTGFSVPYLERLQVALEKIQPGSKTKTATTASMK